MKALSVDQNGKLEVCDVPKPVYGDCQALVKTLCLQWDRYEINSWFI